MRSAEFVAGGEPKRGLSDWSSKGLDSTTSIRKHHAGNFVHTHRMRHKKWGGCVCGGLWVLPPVFSNPKEQEEEEARPPTGGGLLFTIRSARTQASAQPPTTSSMHAKLLQSSRQLCLNNISDDLPFEFSLELSNRSFCGTSQPFFLTSPLFRSRSAAWRFGPLCRRKEASMSKFRM